jgi:hypothetical protein
MTGWLAAQEGASQGREAIRRFGDLIRATPALRAYQADMTDQSASAAAGVTSWSRTRPAPRAATSFWPSSPETQSGGPAVQWPAPRPGHPVSGRPGPD